MRVVELEMVVVGVAKQRAEGAPQVVCSEHLGGGGGLKERFQWSEK